jgi:uncharacterized protein YndB with AHSA1/START domain
MQDGLMRDHTASLFVASNADEVFSLIVSPERLPEWNRAIAAVVETPEHLGIGGQWVVTFAAMGQSWQSRSTVTELDPAARRFSYRSQTDDGNPSYADWSWQVTDASGGCQVTVSYALHPATFWRRALLAKIRGGQLRRRELPASLAALATLSATARNP